MIIQCPKTGRTCEVTGCKGCWKSEQAEQEPVAYLCPSFVDNFATGRYETCEQKDYGAFPIYAAPVRTKDLTDDEIHKCNRATVTRQDFARAVIAADREKNK